MSEVPSAGWREVYRWCHVPEPERIASVGGRLEERAVRPE